MKLKYCLASLICASAMLLQTKSAEATFATVSVNDVVYVGGGFVGGNGEFTIYTAPDATTGYLFDTFCVEKNEGIQLDVPYYVSSIGPSSDGPPVVALKRKAAALYGSFAVARNAESSGTQTTTYSLLGIEDYDQNNHDSNELQRAIWMFQGQVAMDLSNVYVAAANSASSAVLNFWKRGVKIMNLSTNPSDPFGNNPGTLKQSQMYWEDPGPFTEVPEPSSLFLFSIGLVGAGWVSRRRSKLAKSA